MAQNDHDLSGVFDGDEVRSVLSETFYGDGSSERRPRRRRKGKGGPAKATPDHYKVICISMYREDLARLDEKVAELKKSGHRKMSRSALIRFALDHVDLSELPPSY